MAIEYEDSPQPRKSRIEYEDEPKDFSQTRTGAATRGVITGLAGGLGELEKFGAYTVPRALGMQKEPQQLFGRETIFPTTEEVSTVLEKVGYKKPPADLGLYETAGEIGGGLATAAPALTRLVKGAYGSNLVQGLLGRRTREAQEQVGFADRILFTKTDLIDPLVFEALRQRVLKMNPRAKMGVAKHGVSSVDDLFDIRGFNLSSILEIEPDFLTDVDHEHDDDVTSFVFRESRPLRLEPLEDFMDGLVQIYGVNLMRYKGVLNIRGQERRVVFQGVHMLMGSELGSAWRPGEKRESKMVFIGKNMPKDSIMSGLSQCVEKKASAK